MSIQCTEEEKQRLLNLYKVNGTNYINYNDIIEKYINFLDNYLVCFEEQFRNPDYLYSFNMGCYYILQSVLHDDGITRAPLAEDIKNIAWKIQKGEYNSLGYYEKILYLLTQIEQRMNALKIEDRTNMEDMSYMVQLIYQSEKRKQMQKQSVMG